MQRSFVLAQNSVLSRQFSPSGGNGGRSSATGHTSVCGASYQASVHGCLRAISPSRGSRHSSGFTLIELLVVIAIIAILAALTLGTMGYVNRKGAESRARSEVAALSVAIENFRDELGSYPPMDNPQSTSLSNTVTTSNLYRALCPKLPNEWNPQGKVFFEAPPGMVNSNTLTFNDPWGGEYLYRTNTNGGVLINIGSFDLWSTAGMSAVGGWIRN